MKILAMINPGLPERSPADTFISNPLFGDVIMAEVGATMVGGIVQPYKGNSVR